MSNPYDIYQKKDLPLFNQVNKNNNINYTQYRCYNNSSITEQPWFPEKNICPCDARDNNITGRGYTLCNFGVVDKKNNAPVNSLYNKKHIQDKSFGTLFNTNQIIPPQSDPYPFVRIGQEWRTLN